jgi:broad specificity phosphatase PhoE
MEKEPTHLSEEQVDRKEKRGRNVTIHARFVRHGEKATSTQSAETSLSPQGERQAIALGENLPPAQIIKGYSSRTDRTRDTSRLAAKHSHTPKKYMVHYKQKIEGKWVKKTIEEPRYRDQLAFHYDSQGAFAQEAMRLKAESLGHDWKNLPPQEIQKRLLEAEEKQVALYLSYGDKRPDPNTYSPVESAALIADTFNTYLEMADRLDSGSEVDLINASHDFPLDAFLKEVLVRKEGEKIIHGFKDMGEIGGALDFTEGFEVRIQTDNLGQKSAALILRGKEYKIDQTRLEQLVKIARDLKQAKLS